MPLKLTGHIELPANRGSGGFDHAAPHAASGHVYVAHTANDAVDVFDPATRKHVASIEGLTAVAGVLVSDHANMIITSNRGENTIGVFTPAAEPTVLKIPVGVRPNGLAYDPVRRLILAANVGDPAIPGSYTLSMVALDDRAVVSEIAVPGRTRWALFDPEAERFYVNIVDPAVIVVIDARSGKVLAKNPLSGTPDVVFFNASRQQLYVAVGDPGVIDVFDTRGMQSLGRVETEKGAHTTALAPAGDQVFAFLPHTHRAAIYRVL